MAAWASLPVPWLLRAVDSPGDEADRLTARPSSQRGDVPGWVMITLMSAVLVMGLLAIAAPALEGLFQQAISKVSK